MKEAFDDLDTHIQIVSLRTKDAELSVPKKQHGQG